MPTSSLSDNTNNALRLLSFILCHILSLVALLNLSRLIDLDTELKEVYNLVPEDESGSNGRIIAELTLYMFFAVLTAIVILISLQSDIRMLRENMFHTYGALAVGVSVAAMIGCLCLRLIPGLRVNFPMAEVWTWGIFWGFLVVAWLSILAFKFLRDFYRRRQARKSSPDPVAGATIASDANVYQLQNFSQV